MKYDKIPHLWSKFTHNSTWRKRTDNHGYKSMSSFHSDCEWNFEWMNELSKLLVPYVTFTCIAVTLFLCFCRQFQQQLRKSINYVRKWTAQCCCCICGNTTTATGFCFLCCNFLSWRILTWIITSRRRRDIFINISKLGFSTENSENTNKMEQ